MKRRHCPGRKCRCDAIKCEYRALYSIMKRLNHRIYIVAALIIASCIGAAAQDNSKILNRPYADLKPIHFGFSVGFQFQDLKLQNNGFVTENGESWFAEVPSHSPGFCVNVLADLRISRYFNLRFSPGMYFGNKNVKYRNAANDDIETQNVKSNYVVLPFDLKYSASRHYNIRCYIVGGVMGVFDVSKRRSEQIALNTADMMLTVGFGCDFYLPFFKLCPEVKFCFGLKDLLKRNRPDLSDDPEKLKFTNSLNKVTSNMVVVTFYFE